MGGRGTAAVRRAQSLQTYGVSYLLMGSLEVKDTGSLPNHHLICVSRRVLGQLNNSLTCIIKTENDNASVLSRFEPVYRPKGP